MSQGSKGSQVPGGVQGQRLCWGVQGGKVSLKLLDLWHFKSPKPYFFTKKFDFFISINILKSLFITIPESGCKTVDIENVADVTSHFSRIQPGVDLVGERSNLYIFHLFPARGRYLIQILHFQGFALIFCVFALLFQISQILRIGTTCRRIYNDTRFYTLT